MKPLVVCLLACGCDAHKLFINETADLAVREVLAYRHSSNAPPDIFDPPLGPGEQGKMTWHRSLKDGVYVFVKILLEDGREGYISWADTREFLTDPPDDFVLDDELAATMIALGPNDTQE